MIKKFILLAAFCINGLFMSAQNVGSSPDYIKALSADWKGERLADGRPKVSDNLLDRLQKLTLEEAWAELIELGYPNQFEGEWKLINESEEATMVGRAVTAQFMPARPDLEKQVREQGKVEGRAYDKATVSWAIPTLTTGDIYVADGYGKTVLGTIVGSNLGNGVFTRTGKGVVFYGYVRDMEDLRKIKGFNGWIKGSHPSYMRQTILTSINAPIRIGQAIVLPGDAVLAKKDGVLFVPSHLVEHVVLTGEVTKLFDVFGQQRIKEKKYTAGEIDSKWTNSIKKDFKDWVKDYKGQLPMSRESLDKYLETRNF
ncbi:RraA family protein [Segetibacter sp. 3557_3]|uniref:RraA family protein n=1 Tax=Segetibacter sp. 3557_3 TaxID=2547429 RepID=UPI001058AC1E|nr:RraA family protein [Segetibacter sp. 3557_3]TDH28739.1 RraA family protein [Segetibacter sp. 3557_3]